jgi:hypothetical protein
MSPRDRARRRSSAGSSARCASPPATPRPASRHSSWQPHQGSRHAVRGRRRAGCACRRSSCTPRASARSGSERRGCATVRARSQLLSRGHVDLRELSRALAALDLRLNSWRLACCQRARPRLPVLAPADPPDYAFFRCWRSTLTLSTLAQR